MKNEKKNMKVYRKKT